ncbi:MAG TPA: chemotaxis protein CheW [Ignavibacteriaceae bacterium]|nr:chemotaxis protein CheW [Ignavibacteriaceae bacterium]
MIDNPPQLIDNFAGLVIFDIAGKEFCADIKDVSAIINPSEMDQLITDNVKNNSSITVNNIVIPLIDVRKIFGLNVKPRTNDIRILIVEFGTRAYGFVVEKVKEILTMSRELKINMEFKAFKNEPYLLGILHFEGRTFYLPDFKNLYQNKIDDEKL